MLWLKSFHIVFVVTWFAGLFYLPRLFVYDAQETHEAARTTLRVMQKKLLGITHIGGALAWIFGLALIWQAPGWLASGWLQAKLALVVLLTGYHFWCTRLVRVFAEGRNRRSHTWYRWFNEVPTLVLIGAVLLVEFKPF